MTQTILLIGEDATERAMLGAVIKDKLSYNVLECANEAEAIDFLVSPQKERPDLILFDISSITHFSQKIAEVKMASHHIPLIAMTKYADYESAMIAVNSGAQDFLTKPVALERMYITFRNVLILSRIYSAKNGKPTPSLYNNADDVMSFSLLNDDGNVRQIQELEQEAINRAIKHYDGRMTEVARRLGIGRSTLYRKLNHTRLAESA
ncbi:MAG TPA: helix-turn-helix domain-containing protein [Rickettsiales bacterium]|nr:helix-turn-helix domain-containing protein [Rickettsiales bacterium]